MMVCPVCENQQQAGLECDVCGRDLSALAGLGGLAPPPVAVQQITELEVTIPDRVGEVAAAGFAELEANRFGKVEVRPDVTPDLETSSQAPVGEVPVERVADLDLDRAPDDGQRTAAPAGQVVCRYCKNVQQTGTLCDRCGMKLPAPLQVLAPEVPADQWVRCRACGAPGPIGERCRECGRVVAAPES
ncbi:MAG: hypothetical protein IPJ65_19585 [Archangiaceae bacterium]|nr:hypothetical protein [Archangiaceae bacterium]